METFGVNGEMLQKGLSTVSDTRKGYVCCVFELKKFIAIILCAV